MGLPFHFSAGEGPSSRSRCASSEDITHLRTDRAADLGYVSEAVRARSRSISATRLPVIGFCGAPFTLASYMIEGGGSRNYVHTKKMMYNSPRLGRADGQAGRRDHRLSPPSRYAPEPTSSRFSTAGSDASAWKTIAATSSPHVTDHGEAVAEDRARPSSTSAPTARRCCPP